jgi:quercetin dioxygenase-like cupin family protein
MCAQQTITPREALDTLFALNPLEIDGLPWESVEGKTDVQMKTLWRLGDFVQALVRYQPGATTAGEPHLAAHHHVWVVSGAGTIAGRRLVAGSYMHVPPQTRHGVTDVGPDGLTLLQMHRPHAPHEAEALAATT